MAAAPQCVTWQGRPGREKEEKKEEQKEGLRGAGAAAAEGAGWAEGPCRRRGECGGGGPEPRGTGAAGRPGRGEGGELNPTGGDGARGWGLRGAGWKAV